MAWRRHNRNLTHEVFYEGTTIDGSRLEKAMRLIEEKFNRVPKGDLKNRFVAVQYHAGFNPQPEDSAPSHRFPWLEIRNQATVDVVGVAPVGAPYNELRIKGTQVPGIFLNAGGGNRSGTQWAWSRTFSFKKPAVLDSVSLLMHVESAGPYIGEELGGASTGPYEYTHPPLGYSTGDYTADVSVTLDVFNPTTPEDPVMADVVYTRRRWVINREVFTVFASGATGTGWDDMFPTYDSVNVANVRPLQGRLLEDRDLNIPLPAGSKVRISIVIPDYPAGAVQSWGPQPWWIQAFSTTITTLEEVQSI
tara:strand:+ start:2487 stop:3404 length:918 start_codon:yes stop_codon:yes gene_type:complete